MSEKKLNLNQERFCELYASDREFFGNGTQAYIEAYGKEAGDYEACRRAASRLLTNVDILKRIDEYLDDIVMNDQHADKQLGFWMTQKDNPTAAMAAIREYNALKQRITKKLKLEGDPPIALVKFFGRDDEPEASD